MDVLVGVMSPPCVGRYVCAGWCGSTPLCCALCMFWLVYDHSVVLPAMYVLDGVVSPPCVARYVFAGWCGVLPFCCPPGMCWLM